MEKFNKSKIREKKADATQLDINFNPNTVRDYDINFPKPPEVEESLLEIIGEDKDEEKDEVIIEKEKNKVIKKADVKSKKVINLDEIKERLRNKHNNPRYDWQDRKDLQ